MCVLRASGTKDRPISNKDIWWRVNWDDEYNYVCYVLHDSHGAVRRALLTSANLSAAAWGRRRSANDPENADACDAKGALEIRSFELGVCVPVAPDTGEGFPFVFPPSSAGDCLYPYVGVRRNDAPTDKGYMYF